MSFPEAQIRFNYENLISNWDSYENLFWQKFYNLIEIADLLESEEIITESTANHIKQIALDFKVCLEALNFLADETRDERFENLKNLMQEEK